MRILSSCVALIWLAGCASDRSAQTQPQTAAATPASAAAATPTAVEAAPALDPSQAGTGGSSTSGTEANAAVPEPAPLAKVGAPAASDSKAGATVQASLTAGSLRKASAARSPAAESLLTPPSQVGQGVSKLSGCLVNPGAAQKANVVQARAKGQLSPFTGATEAVKVTATKGGLVMSHELSHNCCHKAEVSTEFRDGRVVITELLSGRGCRCECTSEVTTAVGLPSGTYPVSVEVMEPGARRVAHETTITIP